MNNKFYLIVIAIILSSCSNIFEEPEKSINRPDAPIDITASIDKPSSIDISWKYSNNFNINGYNIYRSENENGPFEKIRSIDSKVEYLYTDEVEFFNCYYYYLTAVSNDAESEPSSVVKGESQFGYPSNILVSSTKSGVIISWKKHEHIDSYKIYASDTQDFEKDKFLLAEITENKYETSEEVEYYAVLSVKNGVVSKLSNPISLTNSEIGTPYNFKIKNTLLNIQLSWDPVDGATDYVIYGRVEGAGHSAKRLDITSDTSYIYEPLDNELYYFYITARNELGQESYRADEEGRRLALSAPSNITHSYPSQNFMKLSWDKVEGANSYEVFYLSEYNKDSAISLGKSNINSFTFDISEIEAARYYFWFKSYSDITWSSNFSYRKEIIVLSKPEIPRIETQFGDHKVICNIDGAYYSDDIGVKIWRANTEDGEYSLIGTERYSSFFKYEDETLLDLNSTYFYRVSFYNNSYETTKSDAVSFINSGVTYVYYVKYINRSSDIEIKWWRNRYADYYRVYLMESYDDTPVLIGDKITGTYFKYSITEDNKSYIFQVAGVKGEMELLKSQKERPRY